MIIKAIKGTILLFWLFCTFFCTYTMHTQNILAQYFYATLIARCFPLEINHIIAKFFLQLHKKSVQSILIPRTCKEITTSFPYHHRPVTTMDQSFIIYKFINGFIVYNAKTSQKISSPTTDCYDICKKKNKVVYQDNETFKIIVYNINTNSFSEIITLPTSILNIKISPDANYIIIVDIKNITLYDIHDIDKIQSYIINHDIDADISFHENNTLISTSENNNGTKNIHTWKIDHNTKRILSKIILSNTHFSTFLLSPDQKTLSLFNIDMFFNSLKSGSIIKSDKQGYFSSENTQVLLNELTKYNKHCIANLENETMILRNVDGTIIYTKQINTESFKKLTFSHNKQHLFIPIKTINENAKNNYDLVIHFDDFMNYKKETYIQTKRVEKDYFNYFDYMLDVNKQGLILLRYLRGPANNINQYLRFYDKKGNYLLPYQVSGEHEEKPYFTIDGRKIIYNGSCVLQLYDEKQEQYINKLNQTITCQQALFLFNKRNISNFSVTKESYDYQAINSFEPAIKTFLETILKFNIS